ncbi:hypothetical protein M011DRAFT_473482 [Sporormia fimetaria CBS 119925]|uniref:Zn(2)-C6 fungal-type domain-containing protein n=1 Tax=Sporormia fimetaria CBS 119925 TaxID=1340428 RepID=A0A6A6VSL4_9PLEO|nr:hypothetical protein M011DRAFT_473482 [Sporormia fimetaria CBS 119925]
MNIDSQPEIMSMSSIEPQDIFPEGEGVVRVPVTEKRFCTYCGRRFSRDEHLNRHLRIHTNVKPFRCGDCLAEFNRKDLLSRHMKNTHQSGGPDDSGVYTTKSAGSQRTAKACEACRKSKIKCCREDTTDTPCRSCAKKGIECATRKYLREQTKQPSQMGTQPGDSRETSVVPSLSSTSPTPEPESDEVDTPPVALLTPALEFGEQPGMHDMFPMSSLSGGHAGHMVAHPLAQPGVNAMRLQSYIADDALDWSSMASRDAIPSTSTFASSEWNLFAASQPTSSSVVAASLQPGMAWHATDKNLFMSENIVTSPVQTFGNAQSPALEEWATPMTQVNSATACWETAQRRLSNSDYANENADLSPLQPSAQHHQAFSSPDQWTDSGYSQYPFDILPEPNPGWYYIPGQ